MPSVLYWPVQWIPKLLMKAAGSGSWQTLAAPLTSHPRAGCNQSHSSCVTLGNLGLLAGPGGSPKTMAESSKFRILANSGSSEHCQPLPPCSSSPAHWANSGRCLTCLLSLLCRGAGTGGLGLAVEGPSEAKMSCTDNKDGSCSVEYVPYEPGTYSLNVTYGGCQVPGESGVKPPGSCG